jgi:hypothetical protein
MTPAQARNSAAMTGTCAERLPCKHCGLRVAKNSTHPTICSTKTADERAYYIAHRSWPRERGSP